MGVGKDIKCMGLVFYSAFLVVPSVVYFICTHLLNSRAYSWSIEDTVTKTIFCPEQACCTHRSYLSPDNSSKVTTRPKSNLGQLVQHLRQHLIVYSYAIVYFILHCLFHSHLVYHLVI